MSVEYLSELNSQVEITIELRETHLKPAKSAKAKSKTKSSEWDEKINEITSAACALFNSPHGGQLRLFYPTKVTDPKIIDDMVRRIEQKVLNFAGVATTSAAFKLRDSCTAAEEDDDGLVFLIKPALHFCTVEYHLYLPTDFQVNSISFGDSSSAKIASILEPQCGAGTAVFKKHCSEFGYKERVPGGLREGQTVQFKLLKDEPTNNVTL